jgi:ATP-binding cassette subfamily B protein
VNVALKRYWTLLVRYLRPQWPRMALLGALILAQIGLQLLNPQIVRAFIDGALAGHPPGELTRSALLFLAVAVAGQGLSIAVVYLGQTVAWTATNGLRRDLALHCLQLDMSFHKTHTPGELIERIDGDVTALANFFSQMVVRLLGNGLLAAGILVLLFREDGRIGLVGAAYVAATAVVLRLVQARVVRAWAASRQAAAELFGFVGERLTGTEDIRANGAVPYVLHRLDRLMHAVSEAWLRAMVTQGLGQNAGALVYSLASVAALAVGAALVLRGRASIGTAYLVLYYLALLQGPVERIRGEIRDLQRARASIERVEELLRTRHRHTRPRLVERGTARLPGGPLAVALEEVTFRYAAGAADDGAADDGAADGAKVAGDEWALEDLSFSLAPGRVLGLLGRTGSGKSTLTRLLFRLYDPTAGTLRLGGVELGAVALRDLRRRVGLVTQDVQLFRATVRDNLTLFAPGVPDARLLDAFRELGLWEWFQRLPEGLDTELRDGGRSLSAGEAQLLAFARVMLRDPGLVVLDEASSRLDPATERLLERAVGRLLEGRTAIIVAHRLATVGRADEIMILERGRVIEHGERRTLAGDPDSYFARLLRVGLEEALA